MKAIEEDEPTDQEWLHAATNSAAFDFLNAAEEDQYTLRDGRPFDDARQDCARSLSVR